MTFGRISGPEPPLRSDSRIKPVFFMHQKGISELEKRAALSGASELIDIAGFGGIVLRDFGLWRRPDARNSDGLLREYQSVDWYVQQARRTSRNNHQLNAQTLVGCMMSEPWKDMRRGGTDHYDILLTADDMYSRDTRFVIGLAITGEGTALSAKRFRDLPDRLKYECIKTETMHELGHVFGLVDPGRRDIDHSLGPHCKNRCIMRQGMIVPADWVRITKDRLDYGPLCSTCQDEMKRYLRG